MDFESMTPEHRAIAALEAMAALTACDANPPGMRGAYLDWLQFRNAFSFGQLINFCQQHGIHIRAIEPPSGGFSEPVMFRKLEPL